MHIDYEFLLGASTVIGNGSLQQVGRSLAEDGLKVVKPYANAIWGFIKDRSQPEAIAQLKNNPNIQGNLSDDVRKGTLTSILRQAGLK